MQKLAGKKLVLADPRGFCAGVQRAIDIVDKAIELFGNEGVVDIVGLVGYYNFVAMTLKAFDVQRPVGSELLLPLAVN